MYKKSIQIKKFIRFFCESLNKSKQRINNGDHDGRRDRKPPVCTNHHRTKPRCSRARIALRVRIHQDHDQDQYVQRVQHVRDLHVQQQRGLHGRPLRRSEYGPHGEQKSGLQLGRGGGPLEQHEQRLELHERHGGQPERRDEELEQHVRYGQRIQRPRNAPLGLLERVRRCGNRPVRPAWSSSWALGGLLRGRGR